MTISPDKVQNRASFVWPAATRDHQPVGAGLPEAVAKILGCDVSETLPR